MPTMKNENEAKILTHEELELVTGGAYGGENPVPDDLSDRQRQPEQKNITPKPDGTVIT